LTISVPKLDINMLAKSEDRTLTVSAFSECTIKWPWPLTLYFRMFVVMVLHGLHTYAKFEVRMGFYSDVIAVHLWQSTSPPVWQRDGLTDRDCSICACTASRGNRLF